MRRSRHVSAQRTLVVMCARPTPSAVTSAARSVNRLHNTLMHPHRSMLDMLYSCISACPVYSKDTRHAKYCASWCLADSGWFCAMPGWAVLRKGCRTPQILPNRCCSSTSFIGHALYLGTTAEHLIEKILTQSNPPRFRQCDMLLVADMRVSSLPDTCLLHIQSNNVGAQVSARQWLLNITMSACL